MTEPESLPCWQDVLDSQKSGGHRGTEIQAEQAAIEDADLFVSVVVPAYNEEERLGGMLEEAVDYLEHAYGTLGEEKGKEGKKENGSTRKRKKKNVNGRMADSDASGKGWEIIIVSDGSNDGTEAVAFNFARDHQLSLHPRGYVGPWTPEGRPSGVRIPPGMIRVVRLARNRGKGGAVTHGMRHVRGRYVVFADADGASKFDDLGKLVVACREIEDDQGRGVAVGSRAHMVGSEAVVNVGPRLLVSLSSRVFELIVSTNRDRKSATS